MLDNLIICIKCDREVDDVIKRANATKYGLAAGVFTKNIDTANRLTRALRAGTVWVNCFDVFDAAIPFGGYKMSGIGREKGIYSLNNYLQVYYGSKPFGLADNTKNFDPFFSYK